VHIKKLGLPESVTQTVFERMKTERQLLITSIKSAGEAQSTRTRAEADSEAASTLAKADAEAIRIRGEGESKAAEALAEFRKSPELAVFNMKLDALEQMLKQRTTLVLDQTTSPLDLLGKGQSVSTNNEATKK
jgi:membrane protease subunit HflC